MLVPPAVTPVTRHHGVLPGESSAPKNNWGIADGVASVCVLAPSQEAAAARTAPLSCCSPEQDVEVTVPWLGSTASLLPLLGCHSRFSSSALSPGMDREVSSSSTASVPCLLWCEIFALLESLDE